MTFTRKYKQVRKSGEVREYYAEVYSIRTGKTVKQVYVRSLGREPTNPTNFQIEGVHFSYLAIGIMQGTLTPTDVFEMIENMGLRVRKDTLESIGIRYNFEKKTFFIYLYYQRRLKSKIELDVQNAKISRKRKQHTKDG